MNGSFKIVAFELSAREFDAGGGRRFAMFDIDFGGLLIAGCALVEFDGADGKPARMSVSLPARSKGVDRRRTGASFSSDEMRSAVLASAMSCYRAMGGECGAGDASA